MVDILRYKARLTGSMITLYFNIARKLRDMLLLHAQLFTRILEFNEKLALLALLYTLFILKFSFIVTKDVEINIRE